MRERRRKHTNTQTIKHSQVCYRYASQICAADKDLQYLSACLCFDFFFSERFYLCAFEIYWVLWFMTFWVTIWKIVHRTWSQYGLYTDAYMLCVYIFCVRFIQRANPLVICCCWCCYINRKRIVLRILVYTPSLNPWYIDMLVCVCLWVCRCMFLYVCCCCCCT